MTKPRKRWCRICLRNLPWWLRTKQNGETTCFWHGEQLVKGPA